MKTIIRNLLKVQLLMLICWGAAQSSYGQNTWTIEITAISKKKIIEPKSSKLKYAYMKNDTSIRKSLFKVDQGDKVKWVVSDDSIQSILIKSEFNNIFGDQPVPSPNCNNREWWGIVSGTATGKERYSIYWVSSDGVVYATDPTIQVNPPPPTPPIND